jgi:hypothetical protein
MKMIKTSAVGGLRRCASCGAAIRWVVVEDSGARMPVEAVPDPDGIVDADGERYTSHYASCPHAEKWRKRKKEAEK